MKQHCFTSALLCPALFTLSVLTGCGVGTSNDSAGLSTASPATPQTVPMPPLHGSVFGGHAPLSGARVFLLEGQPSSAGTAPNVGWYQPAKSLLGNFPATNGVASTTTLDTSGDATNGDYYVTTTAGGEFNISGEYSCDSGAPVYLYAAGGNPSTNPAVTLTSVTATPGTADYESYSLVTFQNSGTNLLYQGEQIEFSGLTGQFSGFNYLTTPVSYTVVSADLPPANALTTSQFTVLLPISETGGAGITATQSFSSVTPAPTAFQSAANAPDNPAVVNLAVLGVCGDNGRTDFSTLQYIYMNEVSTAAAAYALAGFFPTASGGGSSQNSGLVTLAQAGSAAANLSWPSGDANAQLGIQIATRNAAQLYDIQGSDVGTGGDGDTHIARNYTPDPNIPATGDTFTAVAALGGTNLAVTLPPSYAQVGDYVTGPGLPPNTYITSVVSTGGLLPNLTLTLSNGTTEFLGLLETYTIHSSGVVPQGLLDTIGNILANCVDSANTAASPSTQCSTLFNLTRSGGTTGTLPVDTATAAIDMAHNPWANVAALINSPTGNAPFQPYATSANDLSVGIQYNYGTLCASQLNCALPDSESVSIDATGNAWVSTFEPGGVAVVSPQGTVTQSLTNIAGSFNTAFDSKGNAWVTDELGTGTDVYEYTGGETTSYAYNGNGGGGQTFYDAVDASDNVYVAGYTSGLVYKFDPGQGTPVQTYNIPGCTMDVRSVSVDFAGRLWIANFSLYDPTTQTGNKQGAICAVPLSGGEAILTDASANILVPNGMAVDANGNAWIAEQGAAAGAGLTEITPTATSPYYTENDYTGGGLNTPNGISVDPAGLVFTSNTATSSLAVFNTSGTALSAATTGLNGSFTQAGTNYTLLNSPRQAAIDLSGDLWVPNGGGTWITEFVGVATPVLTPLSAGLRMATPASVTKP
jgi:sugar lactone lactonase YvrE